VKGLARGQTCFLVISGWCASDQSVLDCNVNAGIRVQSERAESIIGIVSSTEKVWAFCEGGRRAELSIYIIRIAYK
jgi:hypothetical protein